MKNALERMIEGQYRRMQAVSGDPTDALAAAQGEILAAATPELVLEILTDRSRGFPESETRSIRAQIRAFEDSSSMLSRTAKSIRVAHSLTEYGMLQQGQGYTGGIIEEHEELVVHGHSMLPRLRLWEGATEDPIQQAMGDTFYPPMMWAKALRAVAYKNRPESAQGLMIPVYLAELGLSLGCGLNDYGDVYGATGFMPGSRLQGLVQVPGIGEHVAAESIEVFRLSGLCDQAVVNPDILSHTEEFAKELIATGGSLN